MKGSKQISAQGEQFVVALPDRAAAKATMVQAPDTCKAKFIARK